MGNLVSTHLVMLGGQNFVCLDAKTKQDNLNHNTNPFQQNKHKNFVVDKFFKKQVQGSHHFQVIFETNFVKF